MESLCQQILALYKQQELKPWGDGKDPRTFSIEGYPEVLLQIQREWDEDEDDFILVARLLPQQEATPEKQEQVGWDCYHHGGYRIHDIIHDSGAYIKRIKVGIQRWTEAHQTLDGRHWWIITRRTSIYGWGDWIP
jgi:hypothetical protein